MVEGFMFQSFHIYMCKVRKMYQLDANNFTMILSHKWPLHVSDIYMSHLQEFLYIGCFTAACGVMP